MKPFPSVERVRALLHYDQDTGVFTWRETVCIRGVTQGMVAGTPHKDGYRTIRIDGHALLAHRLAWYYMTGEMPENDLDHINRDRSDDRWNNLRKATRSQNMCNANVPCDNKSGVKGVCWDKTRGLWRVYAGLNKNQYQVGRFAKFEDAVEARRRAAEKLHGEFAHHASVFALGGYDFNEIAASGIEISP